MKYAVAAINFFDNDLVVEIHEGDFPLDAILKHSIGFFKREDIEEAFGKPLNEISIEEYAEAVLNCDGAIDIVEIK